VVSFCFALTGMPGGGGILSSAIEHSANPAEPIEAYGLVPPAVGVVPRPAVFGAGVHGNPVEKPVYRGLSPLHSAWTFRWWRATASVSLVTNMRTATNSWTPLDQGRADGVLGHNGRDGYDLPTITVDAVRTQAYVKITSPDGAPVRSVVSMPDN
jgi:hypothetical protein